MDDALIADLMLDEGFRAVVYDDATGEPLRPGMTIKGHPTVGYGWALDVNPIGEPHARVVLGWQVEDKTRELYAALPWAASLPEPQNRALRNMAFNMGVATLLSFKNTLAALKAGDYDLAAMHARDSAWFKQVGDRGARVTALMASGGDPVA